MSHKVTTYAIVNNNGEKLDTVSWFFVKRNKEYHYSVDFENVISTLISTYVKYPDEWVISVIRKNYPLYRDGIFIKIYKENEDVKND